jgi:uncharacterized repeat protein (TIGR02543 family)
VRPRVLAAAACFAASLVFVGTVAGGSHRTLDRVTAERPDEVVGPSVHVIYALPSDAPDQGFDTSGTVASWLSQFNDWLAQQTGGTRIRVDTYHGSTDTSFLQLSQPTSAYANVQTAYFAMNQAITAAGFSDPEKKYVVALPAGNDKVCGIGGGNLAVLFVNQCDNVAWPYVVGHELFHTFGAVNACAAHASNGHTSDPANDLMFPYALDNGETAVLDPGHDDYWGVPGDDHLPAGCPPQANVANSIWLTSHPFYRLHVHSGDHGTASVRPADSFSEDCTPDCDDTGAGGSQFELGAEADAGYRFAGWTGGGCTEEECTVTLAADTTVTANFVAEPKLALSVHGKGRVTAPDLEASCSGTCAFSVPYQDETEFHATPLKGWRFTSWGGACSGSKPTCTVSLSTDATATASFAALPPVCAKGKRSTPRHPCHKR